MTTSIKVLVQLNTVYIDEDTWNTSLEDMLRYDSGIVVEEDKKSGKILVELSRCTIARWESFGFKVTILRSRPWLVKGFTQAEEAQMKKNSEDYEEETHLCCDCGQPCSVEEPLCWNCECGDSII